MPRAVLLLLLGPLSGAGWSGEGRFAARDDGPPALLMALAPQGMRPLGRWVTEAGRGPLGSRGTWPAVPRSEPSLLDRRDGHPVEAAGGLRRHFVYEDRFRQPWFRHDPTIEGIANVAWDRRHGVLYLEGGPGERRRVALCYQFVSPFVMKDPLAEAEGTIFGSVGDTVELAFSPDGRRFHHTVRACGRRDGHAFHLRTEANTRHHGSRLWVRAAAELGPGACVALRRFRTVLRVKSTEGHTVACLLPTDDGRLVYRDTFACPKLFNYAEVQNREALGWERGRVFVRGAGERVVLRHKVVFEAPLDGVAVRVRHAVGEGGASEFGLSLDGYTILARAGTPGGEGPFAGVTELRLEDGDALTRSGRLYLHASLAAGDGAAASTVLRHLEVEGRRRAR